MKLLTSKIDKIEEFSDNSISFTMTVRISDQKLSNFNIQFALDITDDDNTQYFDTNSNFKIIKESKSYSEVQFTVTRFSIDPSINFDRLTNFSSFLFKCQGKNGDISFHIPVFCTPERFNRALDGDEEEEEEEEAESPIHLKILLPADPPK